MRLTTWVAAIAAISSAYGCGSRTQDTAPDATPNAVPTKFTFESIGDGSLASFGWTGGLHDVAEPAGTPFGVVAKNCTDPEGTCAFEGPIAPPADTVNRQRCLNHMSVTCQTDADCHSTPADLAHDRCVFIYDPPTGTPLASTKGVGACAWTYIPIASLGADPSISGTIDLKSGELTLKHLTINLELDGGKNGLRGACAECIGDDRQNDGVKNGICKMSTHKGFNDDMTPDIGKPCDANRYGAKGYDDAQYSMDCAPSVVVDDSPPTPFGGTFTSAGYELAITDASPNCTGEDVNNEKCFCGMCPDMQTACRSNADCGGDPCGALPKDCDPNPVPFDHLGQKNPTFDMAHLPGQCRNSSLATSSVIATRDNACRDGMCNWNDAAGQGTCMSVLTNTPTFCYPHGKDAKILAPGAASRSGSVYFVDTATASCAPASMTTIALNAQLGLPGLIFQKRRFQIIPEYNP